MNKQGYRKRTNLYCQLVAQVLEAQFVLNVDPLRPYRPAPNHHTFIFYGGNMDQVVSHFLLFLCWTILEKIEKRGALIEKKKENVAKFLIKCFINEEEIIFTCNYYIIDEIMKLYKYTHWFICYVILQDLSVLTSLKYLKEIILNFIFPRKRRWFCTFY